MNDEQVREFVRLEKDKRRVEAELGVIEKRIKDLKEALLPQFLAANCQHTSVDGRTVYVHTDIRPSMVNGRESVVAALEAEGLDQYIGVNHQGLGAYVREIAREVEDNIARENAAIPQESHKVFGEEDVRAALPGKLRDELAVVFKYDLRSKQGS